MKAIAIVVATALCAACPSAPQHPRPTVDEVALRIRVAQAEARRSAGVAELSDLALHADPPTRQIALRGLGRVGDTPALAVVAAALQDADRSIATSAAAALGLAGALERVPADRAPMLARAVADALPAIDPRVGYEALGRLGDAQIQPLLATALGNTATAESAAFALGRHGRRKIALVAPAREALIAATASADAKVRYAATYALSREFFSGDASDPADSDLRAREVTALATRLVDSDGETRAIAVYGLAKRKAVASARHALEMRLVDPDWRVVVEAERALAGDSGDDEGAMAVATAVGRSAAQLADAPAQAHVVIEGLRVLASHGGKFGTTLALGQVLEAVANNERIPALTRGWIECLAVRPMLGHGTDADTLAKCGHDRLPDHLRLPLLAQLVEDHEVDISARRAAMRILMSNQDGRVRAAGLGTLATAWHDGDDTDRQTLLSTLTAAIAAKDPIVAGAAVDAASSIYDDLGDTDRQTVGAAIVARAATETEVELSTSLYDLIGKKMIAGGADACRAGLAGHPLRAKAAAECLRLLGDAVASPPDVTPPPPPVDLAAVVGKQVHWHLETTRGAIDIELRPDIAPWSVATIVALTRKGFYDGLEFHRVVPNFVVQGGDPTMSGWGGPGFTTPAEPASGDELVYGAGGVGIADSGPDSGGSQWFVMHSRAAHLEGRYTEVGQVTGGNSADALQIGDRVVKATVDVR